jgi:hypothetical protein
MVPICKRLLTLSLALLWLDQGAGRAEKFFPDDPIRSMPKPLPVQEIDSRKIDALYDFLWNSVRPNPRPPAPAGAVNTLGEVPDSEWFTNRHGQRRLTREQLQRGPGDSNLPVPPFVVVGAKTEGITPGFRMKDAKGRLYFVKPDPVSNPEMSTAADVIGAKFFYALGYNTPENYIVNVRRSQLSVSREAVVEVAGRRRPMTDKEIPVMLDKVPRRHDGFYRLMASLAIPGELIGPFRYEGTRSDDPNDIVPHERRRDLRGLQVFCAWLNHTDSKSENTLNTIVEENGTHYVRHFLLDFGAILGSDSDMAKDARFGHEYIFPEAGKALKAMMSLGLYSPDWEHAKYPKLKAVGRFESKLFDPETWKPNYPNPAFLSRQPDDEYWAAKQVMAFTDEDIRAIVETGQYSDPRAIDTITVTLIERRDKIGKTYFSKVLPLDHFMVSNGRLCFEDLAVKYNFAVPRQYEVTWSRFDNKTERHTPLSGESSFRLPGQLDRAEEGSYFAASVHASGDERKTVTVYLRKRDRTVEVVGIERKW